MCLLVRHTCVEYAADEILASDAWRGTPRETVARADKAKKVREVEEATRKECKEILCREMAMARRG